MIQFGIRIAILLTVVFAAQVSLHLVAPDRGIPSPVSEATRMGQTGVDLLYFGDSTLYRGAQDDSDRRTLPQRVGASFPDRSIGVLAHDAYSPALYDAFVKFLVEQPKPPKRVIVPLHLRSFSLERDRRPEYQFARERYFLRHEGFLARAFFQPLASWGVVELNPISEEAYRSTPVYDGTTHLGSVETLSPKHGDSLNPSNRDPFIELCYRREMQETDRQVEALENLVQTLNEHGIETIFYITPIDVELGETLYGPDFRAYVSRNADFLESYLAERGAQVLNLSAALSGDAFALGDFPDGYLRATGKDLVANAVVEALAASVDSPAETGI